jgi:hypothetical protein
MTVPIYKDIANHGQCPYQRTLEPEKTDEYISNAIGRLVEQVVGRGKLDAPSASPVCCCSQQVAAVLEVDVAGQQRDVAVAMVALAGTTVLSSMAAEIGGESLEKGVAGLANQFSIADERARSGQGRSGGCARYPDDTNLGQIFYLLYTKSTIWMSKIETPH